MGIDKNTAIIQSEDELFTRVSVLIEESRKNIVKAVNTAMVYTYYGVGQYIVEYEQEGKPISYAITVEEGREGLRR